MLVLIACTMVLLDALTLLVTSNTSTHADSAKASASPTPLSPVQRAPSAPSPTAPARPPTTVPGVTSNLSAPPLPPKSDRDATPSLSAAQIAAIRPFTKPVDAYLPPAKNTPVAPSPLPAHQVGPAYTGPCGGSPTEITNSSPSGTLWDYLVITLSVDYVPSGCSQPYYEYWINYNGADQVIDRYSSNSSFDWDTAGLSGGTYQLFAYISSYIPSNPCATNVYDTYTPRYDYTLTRHCDWPTPQTSVDTCGSTWNTPSVGEQRGITHASGGTLFNFAYSNIAYAPSSQAVSPGNSLCSHGYQTIYNYFAAEAIGQPGATFSQSGFAYQCDNSPQFFAVVLTTSGISCPAGGAWIDPTSKIQLQSGTSVPATSSNVYKGCFLPTTVLCSNLQTGQAPYFEHFTSNNSLYIFIGLTGCNDNNGVEILNEAGLSSNGMNEIGNSTELSLGGEPVQHTLADFVANGLYVNAVYATAYIIPINGNNYVQQWFTEPPEYGSRTSTDIGASGPDTYCDLPVSAIAYNQVANVSEYYSYEVISGVRGYCQ